MSKPRILISILNWNKAAITLECVEALRKMACDEMAVDVLVIDNGSAQADYAALRDGVDAGWARVLRLENNLGFTGGHNVSLKMAMEQDYDFVWLLNNDATVQADTLAKLVNDISADAVCGAVSPVIYAESGVGHLNGWGATHDWRARDNAWIPSAAASRKLHETHPDKICLVGTAVMFRVQALCEVGVLDDRLFAYFDDNDIGTRLSKAGWRSKVVFDAGVMHGSRELADQPLYFFHLMFRNELIFWHTHMPQAFRKLLWLKLVNQAMFNVNRLRRRGMGRQADAALLGVWDFMSGRSGAPDLARSTPGLVKLTCRMLARVHEKQLAQAGAPAAGAPMAGYETGLGTHQGV